VQRQKLKRIQIRLPPSLIEWLDDMARFDNARSRSNKIRQILTERYGSTEELRVEKQRKTT